MLSSDLTSVAGAIRSANPYYFWFKFRCKCTLMLPIESARPGKTGQYISEFSCPILPDLA